MTTSWTDPTVIVQGAAEVIALAAAAIIIAQTAFTRRALRESSESRRVAEEALTVARAESRNSTFLALEAVRARIALNAPSAELYVDEIQDAIFSPSPTNSESDERWPDGHEFHIGQTQLRLKVRASVTLLNTGSRSTRFTLHRAIRRGQYSSNAYGEPVLVGTDPGPTDVLLEPGKSFQGYWEVTRSMQEWIDIYDARAAGNPSPEAVLEVHVDDGQDTGAHYIYSVVLGGSALIPKPGLRETWIFAGLYDASRGSYDGVGSGNRPVKVLSWLSKSDNVRLEDSAPVLAQDASADSDNQTRQ